MTALGDIDLSLPGQRAVLFAALAALCYAVAVIGIWFGAH